MALYPLTRIKTRRRLTVALLIPVSFLFAPLTHAVGTVAEALRAALKHYPEYPLHLARQRTSEGYRLQAGALLGGDAAISALAKTDAWTSDDGYREYEAGLSLPLWLPGQRGAKRNIADTLDTQATAELRLLAWEVAGKTLDAAWSLRFAQTKAQQARLQWESSRALEQDIRKRFEAGELARNDLELARQETLERESVYQDALATVEQKRAVWHSYTEWRELPVDLGQEQLIEDPPAAPHPLLEAAMRSADTARARVKDVRLSRRSAPVLTLYAKRDRGAGDDDYDNSLGAEVSLAFGSRAHAAPRIAEAEALLTEAEVALAAAKQNVDLAQAQTRQALERADRALVLATKRDQLARSRTALTERAFKLGESGLYLLLVARQQAATAARDLQLGRLAKQRAITRYNHALGAIPQ